MNLLVIAPATENSYTFEEYLNYDDGTDNRYELVNGRLKRLHIPSFRHILILQFLAASFEREISRLELSYLCLTGAGIRTGWRKSRISDLCIVAKELVMECLDESAICQTAPLLVVEVVSPDSIERDYRYKRSEYAALEIPEYWIVDPLENKVTVLVLDEGLYEERVFVGNQAIVSPTFPELVLECDRILAAGNG